MEVPWNCPANPDSAGLEAVYEAWSDLALPTASMPPSRKRVREESDGDESDGAASNEEAGGSEPGSAPPQDDSQESGGEEGEDQEDEGESGGEGAGGEDDDEEDEEDDEEGDREEFFEPAAQERIRELESQLEAKEEELTQAKAEIERLKALQGPSAASHALVPAAAAASGAEQHKYSVCMLLPEDFNTCAMPKKFKKGKDDSGPGFKFPHAVRAGPNGVRTYIVESRLSVVVCWQLHNVTQSVPVAIAQTDSPLKLTQALYFKLEVVYANSGEVVRSMDIKTKPNSLVTPSDVLNSQQMNDGKLCWKFKFNFESRKCKNTSQEFKLRVSCTNPEAQRYNLTGESPPFMLVSRNTDKVAGQ